MSNFFEKDDAALVELTLLGDEHAYEVLVTRHQRAVQGTAFKITGNSYSAEDASQDAFVSAWMNLSSLQKRESFGPWVCAIAKNCARTLERHYRSTVPDISLDNVEHLDLDVAAEDYTELHDAVDALNEKVREAISLHYFDGLSVKEIAARLGIAEGSVKWRLSEGRKQLRKGFGIMEQKYIENESLVSRVMRQVEQLKLWRRKNSKEGFEADYSRVLAAVESLDESVQKHHAMADVLLLGYWWLPGEQKDQIFERARAEAEAGHNDDVMTMVMAYDNDKYEGQELIDFMEKEQIPKYENADYPKTLAYLLFWLGYEYRCIGKYSKAIQLYRRVLTIVPPENVYHATALAAIEIEEQAIKGAKEGYELKSYSATGEQLRYIGGKLVFWTQPGYSGGPNDNAIFWNAGAADGVMFDEALKPGDSIVASDGKMTYTYVGGGHTVETPAGVFENCEKTLVEGEHYGLTHCETWFCPGVGIVRQDDVRHGRRAKSLLKEYHVEGHGLMPFAVGNYWEYETVDPTPVAEYESKLRYEVTGTDGDSAAIAGIMYDRILGYLDTWEGRTAEYRQGYCCHTNEHKDAEGLVDVSAAMARAAELADSPRRKTQTVIATRVMQRIFDTDPTFTPDCAEENMWNFFCYYNVAKGEEGIQIDDDRRYSFEWKHTPIKGNEGRKMLYSFLDDIIQTALGCVWSDKWVDGYYLEEIKDTKTFDLTVRGGERVETPAGVFENCRRVSFDRWDKSAGYFGGRFEYWYAEGIGIVKFSRPIGKDKLENIWQLTEYSGVGSGYFPTEDGLVRTYEPKFIGDGYRAALELTVSTDESGTVIFHNATGVRDRAAAEAEKAQKETK